MLFLIEHMYSELGLIEDFEINTVVLRRFLVRTIIMLFRFSTDSLRT